MYTALSGPSQHLNQTMSFCAFLELPVIINVVWRIPEVNDKPLSIIM